MENVYRMSSEHLKILVPSLLLVDNKSLNKGNNAGMERILKEHSTYRMTKIWLDGEDFKVDDPWEGRDKEAVNCGSQEERD